MTPEERKEAAAGATELFDSVATQRPPQPLPPTAIVTPPSPLVPVAAPFAPPPPAPLPMEHKMEPKEPPRAAAPAPATADVGHTTILGLGSGTKAEACVGWLVIVDGPGKGNYRTIYAGSNTIGRNPSQRISIDFGDDSISGDQQAFLVYDGRKRQFQLVPNLGRPNLVHLNDAALLAGAVLNANDRITMGRTTLMFVPLCGPDFEWSEAK